jgi:hypothetical protein
MPEQLRIEQALFGYREGHNLVAASVALAPTVRQFLATVTDGSGTENSEGFEAAYTGLPVPETNYYALFCTWPAPEMTRPGCVWSHVLLLDVADLARIHDLSILRDLCLRPATPPGLSDYERTLNLIGPSIRAGLEGKEDLHRAIYLLTALYDHPHDGIVVLDARSQPWDVPVFSLWSQQWPRLRRGFAFSTGSLGDRRAAGVRFDLQIAPLGSKRLWGRGNERTITLEFSINPITTPTPPWLDIALKDLCIGTNSPLHRFFFSYGSDIEVPRAAFVRLVECFGGPQHGEDDDPTSILAQLAAAFPQPSEALVLKRDKLGILTREAGPSNLETVWASAYFLLQARQADAFNRVPLDFSALAGALWNRKRADVLSVLGNLPESERATAFLNALAGVFTPEDIPMVWYEQPAALPRILTHKPTLTADPSAWMMSEAGQHALWESLHATTREPHTWALACVAMLRAQCAFAERDTVTLSGAALFDGLLSWLESADFRLPSAAWREALREPLAVALQEKVLPPLLAALAAWVLDPSQARALRGDRPDVQALAKEGLARVPEALASYTVFWLAALGLQTTGKDGLALLVCAFFHVYGTVARSHYPGDAWEIIAPVLPESTWGLDWDRCKRLRRALRRWLRENSDLAQELIRAAPTAEQKDLVRSLC